MTTDEQRQRDIEVEDLYLHFMEDDLGDGELYGSACVQVAQRLGITVAEVEAALDRRGY